MKENIPVTSLQLDHSAIGELSRICHFIATSDLGKSWGISRIKSKSFVMKSDRETHDYEYY